jgi:secreted trypsin-like serine protease
MAFFHSEGGAGRSIRRAGVLLSASSALVAGIALTGPEASAISHGGDTPSGAAPWMATLAFTSTTPLTERAYCGGTLIAPDRVLTAGHCVKGKVPGDFEVHLGADQLSRPQGPAHAVRGGRVWPRMSVPERARRWEPVDR